MAEFTATRARQRSLFTFLQCELYAFPGRYNAMLRYLISSIIVIIISMTFNVPQLSYSILVVFFGTQQNIVLTKIVFPLLLLANTLAIGCCILIIKFTIDYPMLRLLSVAVLLLLLLYTIRSSNRLGPLFFPVAICITFAQSFVDQTSNGEALLRNLLWLVVSGGYAVIVTFIVNIFFLPVEPVKQLKREMERILTTVSRMLNTVASGTPVKRVSVGEIQNSVLALHKYLKFSVIRDTNYHENEDQHLSQIATVERLYSATRGLHDLELANLSLEVIEHCHQLSEECQTFLQSILKNEAYHPRQQELEQIMELPDSLREMYSALNSTSLLMVCDENKPFAQEQTASAQRPPKKRLSYDHIKFAVKTLLSVAICYVFYTSVQWPGIHTSMLTCIIVALPSIGAAIQKSLLRITGCLIGSGIALFATVFIVPRLDSIAGLLLLVAPVIAISGWVAAGSERSSYAGIQIIFAFSLAMFTDFAPSPELPEIRDRVIGILLGIIVSTLVQTQIWPESQSKILRKSIADLFTYFTKKMSTLILNNNAQSIGWKKLDSTQKILTQVSFEPSWHNNDNKLLALNAQIVISKLRELHIALFRLETAYTIALERNMQSRLFLLVEQLMQALAVDMNAYGQGLKNESTVSLSVGNKLSHKIHLEWDAKLAPWEKSLLHSTEEVIMICSSIPMWDTEGDSI
ncbi:FUSC family protein [Serratia surfactantfaciens]|uniref:FUSC family protein n=1 Tax=Serratia surfactantfaciens TaxID=2741499 RepID=UPI0018E3FDBC|nr:FUSC family protein [Serratia surfactantfaciens]MBI6152202.1 FUSC family protein [Serratia surfactantfaciens]